MLTSLVIAAAGVVLVLAAAVVATRRGALTRSITRSFHCPYRDTRVTVEYRQETFDDRLTGVASCSAFDPGPAVRCGAPCLDLPPATTARPLMS
jgi:hypothetical protein